MPTEWAERITHHDEDPLWTAGWIPLEPQDHKQVAHPYHGHGCWQTLQASAPHQHQGWMPPLPPMTHAARCGCSASVHAQCHLAKRSGSEGAGIPPSPHAKARALFAGLHGSLGPTYSHPTQSHRAVDRCIQDEDP